MPRKSLTYVQYVNKKYSKELNRKEHTHMFSSFDDYIMWLWYEKFKKDDLKYYEQLEDDLIEYVELQRRDWT